ncbi:restriction endonuclease subunit S [Streptomyces sp. NRRL S-146]|uniref:restriction endonuclease subunit S n=1 Tax=Streptomyces sp. NRRL S-146 TaxID=1463884 RepID=UPI00131D42A7|nr:restriction endonuclease subunit S [Streptomyces sp. NRRL S-146]
MGDGEFRDERAYISHEHFEDLRAHEAVEGDLLLASLGETLPRVAILPKLDEPSIVKADVIRARLHPEILTKWVYYALLAPQTRAYAGALIRGVGRPRLGMAAMKAIPVPMPPLAEQHRIVEALEEQLSRIGSGAATLTQARRRLEGLRKRALVSSVPDEVPSSWKMTTVEGAGTLELGRARHPDWHHGPEMRPYLRVANVFEDRIDTRDVMEMDFSGVWEKYRLEPGDVLLNEGQSPHLVGRPALYRGNPKGVAFTNSLLRFKAGNEVLPEWALLVFRRHLHAKRFMREVRITTNIAHLSAKRLKKVEFPVPPLDVQKQLVQRCEELLSGIAAMDRQVSIGLRRADALKASLLRQAFTGGLVTQNSDDEPASTLLARIAAERAAQPKLKRTRKAPDRRAAESASVAPEPTPTPALAVQQEFDL